MNLLSLAHQNKHYGVFQQSLIHPHVMHTLAQYTNYRNFKGRDFVLQSDLFEGKGFRNLNSRLDSTDRKRLRFDSIFPDSTKP